MTEKLPSEIFEDAAQHLREHGRCTGNIMNASGQVCLVGAVGVASGLTVTEKSGTSDITYGLSDEVRKGLEDLCAREVPKAIDRIKVDSCDPDRFADWAPNDFEAWHINDFELSSGESVYKDTEIEEALMRQAKAFREQGR